jgi:hypothetical protein
LTGPAAQLAAARTAAGRDPGELAYMLGISYEAYDDLERYDDELMDAISFRQLLMLAEAISLDLHRCFDAGAVPALTFLDLKRRLDARRRLDAVDLETFEEQLGWSIAHQLEDPSAFADLPADALADIAAHVGADWRGLLPPSSGAT